MRAAGVQAVAQARDSSSRRLPHLSEPDHPHSARGQGQDVESFTEGLQSALEARLKNRLSPGTGDTGSSGQEDWHSESDDELHPHRGRSSVASTRCHTPAGEPVDTASREHECLVAHPRHPAKICWDVIVGIITFYTILVLPWRIGFQQDAEGSAKIFDYCVDVMFVVDMIVCFRTGYFSDNDAYVSDPCKIAKRYVRGFFFADFISCIPLDLLVEAFSGNNGGSGTRSFKLMKFVRLMRLMKLMRLLKMQRFLHAIEQRFDINPHAIRMVKLIIKIIFLAHLLACCWFFVALPVCGDDNISEPCPEAREDEPINWVRAFGVDHFDLTSKYIASFQFVTATMMAVGYGDISPTNTVERVFSVLAQLIGATAFGFILSAVTTLLDAANPRETELKKRMSEVKEWLSARRIPKHLRRAIREHLRFSHSKKSIFHEEDILSNVPVHLRNIMVRQSYERWVEMMERCWPKEDPSMCVELVMHSKAFNIAPEEIVIEIGEISMEIFVVASGRLEARMDLAAEPPSADEWAQKCLQLTDTARNAACHRDTAEGEMPEDEEDEGDSSSHDDIPEVLAGIYDQHEAFGLLPACPLAVVAVNRCELLSVHKDILQSTLHRFPGAVRRCCKMETEMAQEVQTVLESPMAPEDLNLDIPCKSSVLVEGVATAISLVLDELSCYRTNPTFSSPLSPGSFSSRESADGQPGEKERPSGVDGISERSSSSLRRSANSSRSANSKGSKATSERSTTSWQTSPLRRMLERWGLVSPLRVSKNMRGAHLPGHLRTLRLAPGTMDIVERDEFEGDLLERFIVPPLHRHKIKWDLFVGMLIVYSVLTIPYRIGFGVEAEGGWLAFDWIVDAFFFFDMLLCCRTAYVDENGLVNTLPAAIRKKYVQSWFTIDFFSTFPVDRIVEAVSGAVSTQTRALKLVRIVRLARLLKLARLMKMGHLMQVFEEVAEVSPMVTRCIKLGGRLFMMAHLLGCFWYYTAVQAKSDASACSAGLLFCDQADATAVTWFEAVNIREDQKWDQYVASLYWSFTTMTTVGYGDINPKTDFERIYSIGVMIFGATIFGYIVGSIAALAGNGKLANAGAAGENSRTRRRIMMIRDFCDEQRMTKKTQDMVKQHYQFYHQEKSSNNEDILLHILPPSLRKQVILHCHDMAIQRLGLFQGPERNGLDGGPLPDWLVALLARLLDPQVVSAGEDILSVNAASAQELFFVFSGECEAYIPRGWTSPQCDTGGSGDLGGTSSTEERNNDQRYHRDRTILVFTVGCMFGLEHLLQDKSRYQVRSSRRCPSFLYVLRQSAVTKTSRNVPMLSSVIRAVIANALIQQMRSGIPQWNMELRRRKQSGMDEPGSNRSRPSGESSQSSWAS